jgi:hypothetical protein
MSLGGDHWPSRSSKNEALHIAAVIVDYAQEFRKGNGWQRLAPSLPELLGKARASRTSWGPKRKRPKSFGQFDGASRNKRLFSLATAPIRASPLPAECG